MADKPSRLSARGVVVATGEDSTGFLARCVEWFSRMAPHDNGRPSIHNWRCGCSRSMCGLGFSLLYYESTPEFHSIIKRDEKGFEAFKAEELHRCPTRLLFVKNADPLLFELMDEPRDVSPLRHFYCSFLHTADKGFLGRLCRELEGSRIVVVQHDAIMVKSGTSSRPGTLDHAMRCYVPAELLGVERFKATMQERLNRASSGSPPTRLAILPPEPSRGIATGELPPACRIDNQPLACLCFVGDVRDKTIGFSADDHATGRWDRVVARSLPATRLLAECSDVAEMMRDANGRDIDDESRPIIRLSMRTLGGWAFVSVCVPVRDEQEARSLGIILERRLSVRRVIDRSQIRLCQGIANPPAPWASMESAKSLTKLEHNDRPGYLADYFRHVGDLTDRVSVIQYDSWAEGAPSESKHTLAAAHRLCISATNPGLKQGERDGLVKAWETRHATWGNR